MWSDRQSAWSDWGQRVGRPATSEWADRRPASGPTSSQRVVRLGFSASGPSDSQRVVRLGPARVVRPAVSASGLIGSQKGPDRRAASGPTSSQRAHSAGSEWSVLGPAQSIPTGGQRVFRPVVSGSVSGSASGSASSQRVGRPAVSQWADRLAVSGWSDQQPASGPTGGQRAVRPAVSASGPTSSQRAVRPAVSASGPIGGQRERLSSGQRMNRLAVIEWSANGPRVDWRPASSPTSSQRPVRLAASERPASGPRAASEWSASGQRMIRPTVSGRSDQWTAGGPTSGQRAVRPVDSEQSAGGPTSSQRGSDQ